MAATRKRATARKATPEVAAQPTAARPGTERRHSVDRRVGTEERRIHADRRLHLVPPRSEWTPDSAPVVLPPAVADPPAPPEIPRVSLQAVPALPALAAVPQIQAGFIAAPVFKAAIGLGLAWFLLDNLLVDSPAPRSRARVAKSGANYRRVRD